MRGDEDTGPCRFRQGRPHDDRRAGVATGSAAGVLGAIRNEPAIPGCAHETACPESRRRHRRAGSREPLDEDADYASPADSCRLARRVDGFDSPDTDVPVKPVS